MNLRNSIISGKILAIVVLSMLLSPLNVFADGHGSMETEDLLPQYSSYSWAYHGSVEYGHEMKIESIVVEDSSKNYFIEGEVYDASGGESDADYSLELKYQVMSDVIIQSKTEEMMLDSNYDEIEIIRTPLEEGTSWSQDVVNSQGEAATLESTITAVEETQEGFVFTVRYEDTDSDYYEERRIQEDVGVVFFEKLMTYEDDSYPMGYSIFEAGTGVEMGIDFIDVTGEEWYVDHVSRLVSMGYIEGYPDETFRADGEITVAEFIKIAVESLGYFPEKASGEWYEPYFARAMELGLISEGEFEHYNRPITREEMTKIIVLASGEEVQGGQLDFADAGQIDAGYLAYVNTAVELGMIQGYPADNTFRPDRTSTRAEASKLFVILIEDMIQTEEFNVEDALALESEFENRLYQETEADSWVVIDFDTKEELVDHISEIADRDLAQAYIDNYYDYMEGELVLPPKDGITAIIEDRSYSFEMVNPREYQLIQETTTEIVGHYTITITYRYESDGWIMENRDLEVHEL